MITPFIWWSNILCFFNYPGSKRSPDPLSQFVLKGVCYCYKLVLAFIIKNWDWRSPIYSTSVVCIDLDWPHVFTQTEDFSSSQIQMYITIFIKNLNSRGSCHSHHGHLAMHITTNSLNVAFNMTSADDKFHEGGGVTQDVGSGTIGVKKCGKWDYRGEKMWEVGLSL